MRGGREARKGRVVNETLQNASGSVTRILRVAVISILLAYINKLERERERETVCAMNEQIRLRRKLITTDSQSSNSPTTYIRIIGGDQTKKEG